MQALCRALDVSSHHAMAAYEDVSYYLWKEQTLPINVDPFDYPLDDPLERERLARVYEQGLRAKVGYVLPLEKSATEDGWLSDTWELRRGRLYLVPGDSPIGFRLPLDTLAWEQSDKRQVVVQTDPFEPRGPLEDYAAKITERIQLRGVEPSPQTPTAEHLIRTSLCIEPRRGCLRVFMPPCTSLENYVELVTAIESAASTLQIPLVIEGYEPPPDHRVRVLQVTPDPGVIEVNVAPVSSWREPVDNTTQLYEEARLARLTTEKFMSDGRHIGTGGGNHVTLGGQTPADSPLLRRPDLLGSLVSYWQHHPSLSCLFSGLFVGPTSQAPRIDEARDDALKELEIALSELPRGEVATPWLADRLFRNILVDVTGNTHRAEFCIDKLYSPDQASLLPGYASRHGTRPPVYIRPYRSMPRWYLTSSILGTRGQWPGALITWVTPVDVTPRDYRSTPVKQNHAA